MAKFWGVQTAAPASLALEKRRVSEGRQGSAHGAVCSRKRQRRPPCSSGRSGVTSVSHRPTRLRVQQSLHFQRLPCTRRARTMHLVLKGANSTKYMSESDCQVE